MTPPLAVGLAPADVVGTGSAGVRCHPEATGSRGWPRMVVSVARLGAVWPGSRAGLRCRPCRASPEVEVSEVAVPGVTAEVVDAFDRLIPQLSRSNPPPTADELAAIAASEASILLVARDPDRDGEIVGQPHAGDVPHPHRACGRGSRTSSSTSRPAAGAWARRSTGRPRPGPAAGCRTVDLTSRPSRRRPTASTSASASSPARPTSTASSWADRAAAWPKSS